MRTRQLLAVFTREAEPAIRRVFYRGEDDREYRRLADADDGVSQEDLVVDPVGSAVFTELETHGDDADWRGIVVWDPDSREATTVPRREICEANGEEIDVTKNLFVRDTKLICIALFSDRGHGEWWVVELDLQGLVAKPIVQLATPFA